MGVEGGQGNVPKYGPVSLYPSHIPLDDVAEEGVKFCHIFSDLNASEFVADNTA